MEIIIWIFQVLLALVFIMAAGKKLAPAAEEVTGSKQMSQNISPAPIRVLGILELLGAVGIIAPQLLHIYPLLTPITAVCFCVVLIGAFYVHLGKGEVKKLIFITVSFILSVAVAYYRFN